MNYLSCVSDLKYNDTNDKPASCEVPGIPSCDNRWIRVNLIAYSTCSYVTIFSTELGA